MDRVKAMEQRIEQLEKALADILMARAQQNPPQPESPYLRMAMVRAKQVLGDVQR